LRKNSLQSQDLSHAWQALSLLKPFLHKYGVRLAAGFAALLCVDFLQLFIPRFIKGAVDRLHDSTATGDRLMTAAGLIVLFALGIGVCRFFWRYLILGFSRLLERDLRNRLLEHLLTLDRPFFQQNPPGQIMALATNDLAAVQLAAGMGLVASLDAVVMTFAALGFMAYINPSLTLIAVAPMPMLVFLTRLLSARLHRRFTRVQEQFSRLTEFSRSAIGTVRLLKAYNQEKFHAARFNRLGLDYVRDNLRLATVHGTLFPVSILVANLSLLLVMFFGGRLAIERVITVGDFVAFISYLFMLTWPMMAMGWVVNLFQRGVTSLNRLRSIFDNGSSLAASAGGKTSPIFKGAISIRHLDFTYPGQAEPVLQGINLEVPAGGMLGIVGPTGSGKTTLCHLLARLYPVAGGAIFFDGTDVNDLELNRIRGWVAYVPQDVVLFSDTVAENIALGKPDATQEQIESVAKTCAIHEEIMRLPQGYRTRIGEKGVKLSGGQRQRLTLARALLLDRPLLIIDDGLSAVDPETETAITRALGSRLKGRTCIIVSHRIAPLANAHKIAVLEEGRCPAVGTHAELLTASRFYASIYAHQSMAAEQES
jgi:ATP-binding cassette subfamily B protein